MAGQGTVIGDFSVAVRRLRDRVSAAKRAMGDAAPAWYRYETFSNIPQIERLLDGRREAVLDAAISRGIVDVGCGDGELSFLFESLGAAAVTAIDNPTTNHNGMRGVWALKQQLASSVDVRELDVDSQFAIPRGSYGLSLLLGILYHLKNPFHVLDVLARASDYCLLSTRIARRLPDGTRIPDQTPVAYLLDPYELNGDYTNYWIFSEAGLKRLLRRTNWEILSFFTVGDRTDSDPVSLAHDERAFCLLRSHFGLSHLDLDSGWYEPEDTGWRWTRQQFGVTLKSELSSIPRRMIMRAFLPDVIFKRFGALTLSIAADGVDLKPAILDDPGDHVIEQRLQLQPRTQHNFLFRLNKAFLDEGSGRELGMIVSSIEFE